MNNEEQKLVEKLCSKLFLEHAYFLSVLAIYLNIEIKSDPTITASANTGGTIVLGKEFLANLTTEEQIGLLAHELYHVAFLHPQYMRDHAADKDLDKCNSAMDYEINLLIEGDGLSLPPNPLLDKKYKGLTHQQIYDLLPDSIDNSGGVGLDVKGDGGENTKSSPGPGVTEAKDILSDLEVAEVVQQAIMQSEMQSAGSTPKNIKLAVGKLLQPKMDWAEILKEYIITEFAKSDWSWKRPSRRYIHSGMYLPSQNSLEDVIGKIAVCIDVSGSIDQELLDKFMGEVSGIVSDIRPKETIVKLFDTRTTLTKKFLKNEPITKIDLIGGGGTHLHSTFKELKKIDDILCVVVLTDMYISDLANVPKLDTAVLWCRYRNTQSMPPYGRTIDLEI